MAYIALEDFLKEKDSLYKLVILASKRALELSQGAPPLVETTSKQPATIALEEIRQHKVTYRAPEAMKEPKKKRDARGG